MIADLDGGRLRFEGKTVAFPPQAADALACSSRSDGQRPRANYLGSTTPAGSSSFTGSFAEGSSASSTTTDRATQRRARTSVAVHVRYSCGQLEPTSTRHRVPETSATRSIVQPWSLRRVGGQTEIPETGQPELLSSGALGRLHRERVAGAAAIAVEVDPSSR